MDLGQKNVTVNGLDTLTGSPPISISDVKSISGEISFIYLLNAIESRANMFCEKAVIVSGLLSPSISMIV